LCSPNDFTYSGRGFKEREIEQEHSIENKLNKTNPSNHRNNLPFHVDNLDLILSRTNFQNAKVLGFPPIFMRRYLNVIWLSLRHLEKIILSISHTPIVPICLLWKLTLRLDDISKHLITALIVVMHWKLG